MGKFINKAFREIHPKNKYYRSEEIYKLEERREPKISGGDLERTLQELGWRGLKRKGN